MVETVTVRIPSATYETLKQLLNSEIMTDSNGKSSRVKTVDVTETWSKNQVVNTAILGFLAGELNPNQLNALTYATPSVSQSSVTLAAQRLAPKQAVVIPANTVAELIESQEKNFNQIKHAMTVINNKNNDHFGFMAKTLGAMYRGIAFLAGFTATEPVTSKNTFAKDYVNGAMATLDEFGKEVAAQEINKPQSSAPKIDPDNLKNEVF